MQTGAQIEIHLFSYENNQCKCECVSTVNQSAPVLSEKNLQIEIDAQREEARDLQAIEIKAINRLTTRISRSFQAIALGNRSIDQ